METRIKWLTTDISGRTAFIRFSVSRVMVTVWQQNFDRAMCIQPMELLISSSPSSRYRKKFKLFWLRGDSAFADPDIYKYCEANRIIYFIRLRENAVLTKLIRPHLQRPVGRPPQYGLQVKYAGLEYQAGSWERPRRVVARSNGILGNCFPGTISS